MKNRIKCSRWSISLILEKYSIICKKGYKKFLPLDIIDDWRVVADSTDLLNSEYFSVVVAAMLLFSNFCSNFVGVDDAGGQCTILPSGKDF